MRREDAGFLLEPPPAALRTMHLALALGGQHELLKLLLAVLTDVFVDRHCR
jgi:hypothetical protein